MGIQTGANTIVSIGTTTAMADAAAYALDTWQAIGGTEGGIQFGDSSAEVTFTGLGDGRVQKLKGARDAGTVTLTMAFIGGDQGQDDLATAEADNTSSNYNFKVEYPDGEIRYFSGQVASYVENVDGANSVIMLTCEIRINTAIFRVAAA